MSFGSSMRFEVKDGGKGGIFWQKETGKPPQKKFGYKLKGLRHPIRKPEHEYIEEPKAEKPRPSKDFIRKNRAQYSKPKDDDAENERSGSRPSSSIKPGTVTLTQDQLNALLATVGKLKPGEGNNVRISIDAESNTLQVDSPRDNLESAPNSNRSDAEDKRSAKEEIRDSSGYGSEEKSSGGKGVRFDTARNQERQKTPEPSPAPPPMVPWRHMTVAERKRLQWAREKEAEQELQRQRNYGPWGHPASESPQKQPDPEPKAKNNQPSEREETHEEKLRKAIDAIEAKYGDLLNLPPPETEDKSSSSPSPPSKQSRGNKADRSRGDGRREGEGDKAPVMGIPGLDTSYALSLDQAEGDAGGGRSQASKQREDKGNTRPPRRPDRQDPVTREDKKSREERRKEARKPGRKPAEEERGRGGGGEGGRRREEEGRREGQRKEEGRSVPQGVSSDALSFAAAAASPAAMQTSLFIGSSEPDTSQLLSKKEQEKKKWLEELDRQREEKRLQKQKDRERERQGVDDTWADRFVAPSSRAPPPPPQQQRHQSQPQLQLSSYSTATAGAGDWERPFMSGEKDGSAETAALPPAAMRSAMTIGNVAPNMDKIQQRQAEEKRLWLEELNKQREEQREARMRLKDKQREPEDTWANRFTYSDPPPRPEASNFQYAPPTAAATSIAPSAGQFKDYTASGRVGSAPQPDVSDSLDQDAKTHLRGQNVQMDPVTRKELEDKRRKHLEYQEAIKAQMEEKERQKREEREWKWREEIEGERKLQAERDALERQLETENSKNRQREEARQRQVEQLKSLIDAEQERAQEQRMMKRLATLQQAGHDVSGLRAHYEAITPRMQPPPSIDPTSIPGLMPSPRDGPGMGVGANNATRSVNPPATYRAAEGPPSVYNSQELYGATTTQSVSHEPYVENRVLTPSRFRQPSQPRTLPSSPQREFATQTDDQLALSNGLRKELSEVEIEYKRPPPSTKNTAAAARDGKKARTKSAERKRPAENVRGKPPPAKQNQNRQKPTQKQQKGKPSTWNYQNPAQKAPVKQSEKDLFYEQKKQESEERRSKRERQLQYLVELNRQAIPSERQGRGDPPPPTHHPADSDDLNTDPGHRGRGRGAVTNGDLSHRSHSPPVNVSGGKYRPNDRSRSPPVPTVRRKTGPGHPPAARDYETEVDVDTHNYYGNGHPRSFSPPAADSRGNVRALAQHADFVPFTRTIDVLDPARADEPVLLSRENSRVKQARQNYHETLRPSEYGNQLDMYRDEQRLPAARGKDPILNPGLVKDHPTARQDQILQQLSSLKQSLIQRRLEIETCMSPSDLEK